MPWMCFRAPVFTLILALTGCATPPITTVTVDPRASLEVVNRTALDWEIALSGWTLGQVPAGGRAVFRQLRTGPWRLTAYRGAYSTKRRRAFGSSGRTTVWEILPPAGRTPLPVPPRLGVLVVRNRTSRDLTLRIDDGPLRSLLADDTRRLEDIPAGTHTLHAHAPGTRYHRAVQVRVRGDAVTTIDAPVEVGGLEVRNRTGEAVRVLVDGIERRTVPDGVAGRIDGLLAGVHDLRAVGTTTRRENLRRVDIAGDKTLLWDLSEANGRVRLLNRTGEHLDVSVDDAAAGELLAGKTLSLDNVPLGQRMITAVGRRTGYRWTAEMPVLAGHVLRWTVREDAGTLRVSNELSEDFQIRLGKRVLGLVPAGQTRFFDDIPGGPQHFSAFGRTSSLMVKRKLDVTPAESVEWDLRALEGRLHVRNRTAEDVWLYADARPLGRLAAGEQTIFTQLPVGERLLEARGVVSDEVNRVRLVMNLSDIVVWDIARSAGRVRVINRSGEALVLPPGLRVSGDRIEDGQTSTFLLPVGHRRLHLVGAKTQYAYHRRLHVRVNDPIEWTVEELRGVIHLFNRSKERQRVTISVGVGSAGETFDVDPGRDRRVTVSVGPHRLVAVGVDTSNAREGTVVVRSRAAHAWEIRPGLAYVRISNATPEDVDVRRDGVPLGFVSAGTVRTFGPWPAGKRELSAQGRWSRTIYDVSVDLVAGRVESWTLVPARGALLISNRRSETIRVLLDHEEVAIVLPNQQLRIEVPLGRHLVELVGRTTHALFLKRIRVRPDRTYSVDAPAGPSELLIQNRLAIPLTIRIDNAVRGVVEGHTETRILLHTRGEVVVYAVSVDGRLRWHRQLDVREQRRLRWEIKP